MSSAQPLATPISYFGSVKPVKYEGLKSDNPLAFRPSYLTGFRLPK